MISGRVLLVGIIALAGCQTPAGPYDFRATPASPVEGDDLTLSLTPTKDAASPGVAPVDLYVSVTREGTGPRAWLFLDPAGRWTAARVRYRRIEPGDPEPVVMRFARVNPFGQYSFRAQLVRAGATPARTHYLFPPAVLTLRIRPATAGRPWLVAALGLVTASAAGLVVAYPRIRPAAPGG